MGEDSAFVEKPCALQTQGNPLEPTQFSRGTNYLQSSHNVRTCLLNKHELIPGLTDCLPRVGKSAPHPKAWLLTHGVTSNFWLNVKPVIYPAEKSRYMQRLVDKLEEDYSTSKNPVARSHKIAADEVLPENRPPAGVYIPPPEPAGKTINPPKSRSQVEEESQVAHDMYVLTHHDYNVGEGVDRKYDWGDKDKNNFKFGLETPCNHRGQLDYAAFSWVQEMPSEDRGHLVSRRLDEWCAQTHPLIGKVHDPNRHTRSVGADHAFGLVVKPTGDGAFDLLTGRAPEHCLHGQDYTRGLVACVRHHLKKANDTNFTSLKQAFEFYDRDGKGYINADDMRKACCRMNVPVDDKLVGDIMRYCAVSSDKQPVRGLKYVPLSEITIDFEKFCNFLTFPSKFEQPQPYGLMPERKYTRKHMKDLPPPVKRLQKQLAEALTGHSTSSATHGAMLHKSQEANSVRTSGIPTIRSDLPAPRWTKVADRRNYGDESMSYGLMYPNIHSRHGVFERDFYKLRCRDEIRAIYHSVGIGFEDEEFERVWRQAVRLNPGGDARRDSTLDEGGEPMASMEAFRRCFKASDARHDLDVRLRRKVKAELDDKFRHGGEGFRITGGQEAEESGYKRMLNIELPRLETGMLHAPEC